jgi:SEC-C motif domain protein
MRSRYTAFALGDDVYLARTWHPRTRPDEIAADAATRWRGLTVLHVHESGDSATVSFRAQWERDGRTGVLAERSRFVRRAGRWTYVDGDVDETTR